jgi:hypothetical protein
MMPPSLDILFIKNNDVHQYNTRGASNLRAPRIRTSMAAKFITTTGVKLWNDFSTKIDPSLKISNFKQKLITLLIANYHD